MNPLTLACILFLLAIGVLTGYWPAFVLAAGIFVLGVGLDP